MKVACIDIGTNSIRLLLSKYESGQFYDSTKKLKMTRIGKGVNETKRLDDTRMLESADAIQSFYKEAILFGAEAIYMMATSAVRDAENSDAFRNLVFDKTGQWLEIISGKEEAEVGFAGVLAGRNALTGNVLVIDIGGGSTELIVGDTEGIKFAKSLDIGAVRLTGAFIHHDPVIATEKQEILTYTNQQIQTILSEIMKYDITSVIGIGGTATTYATMAHQVKIYSREAVHGLVVTRQQVSQINELLFKSTLQQRYQIVGLEEKRADIILAGGWILEALLEAFNQDTFESSDYDNLEGYIAYKLSEKH